MKNFYEHSVLDLALIFKDNNYDNWDERNLEIILIELNPFGKSSGSALFNWIED